MDLRRMVRCRLSGLLGWCVEGTTGLEAVGGGVSDVPFAGVRRRTARANEARGAGIMGVASPAREIILKIGTRFAPNAGL